jgi:hypothetical protein
MLSVAKRCELRPVGSGIASVAVLRLVQAMQVAETGMCSHPERN